MQKGTFTSPPRPTHRPYLCQSQAPPVTLHCLVFIEPLSFTKHALNTEVPGTVPGGGIFISLPEIISFNLLNCLTHLSYLLM